MCAYLLQFRLDIIANKLNLIGTLIMTIILTDLLAISSQQDDKSKIILNITENTKVGSRIGHLFNHIIPRPSEATTNLTLLKNSYFTIINRDVLKVIGEIDRDNNPQLCNSGNKRSKRARSLSYKSSRKCIWKSMVFVNSGIAIYSIEIHIIDLNDNTPKWHKPTHFISITEQTPIKQYTQHLPKAYDPDEYPNNTVKYEIEPPSKYLYISYDAKTGIQPVLKLRTTIDRELISWHNVTVLAIDGGGSALTSKTGTLSLYVKIIDINDNRPIFESSEYKRVIRKNIPVDTEIDLNIQANDMDEGRNSMITYRLSVDSNFIIRTCFQLHPKTAIITVKQQLIGQYYMSRYKFSIEASDSGLPQLTARTTIILSIKQEMLIPPHINILQQHYPIIIPENEEISREIIQGHVENKNDYIGKMSTSILCDLQGNETEKFRLLTNKTTANILAIKIKTTHKFDREMLDYFPLIISCKFSTNQPLSSTRVINVKIGDVNDNKPVFYKQNYEFKIHEENQLHEKIGQVQAFDKDSGINAQLTYQIHSMKKYIRRGTKTDTNSTKYPIYINEKGEIFTSDILDRELNSEGFYFQITATDKGKPPLSSTCSLHIKLLDRNDNSPIFQQANYTFKILEDFNTEFTRRLVGSVKADDRDLDYNRKLQYSIIQYNSPLPFRINSNSGEIFTTNLLDREYNSKPYSFSVQAVDSPKNMMFRKTGSTLVRVIIKDRNDNSPEVIHPDEKTSSQILLSYHSPPGNLVVQIKARDRDQGDNARLSYEIMDPDRHNLFKINSHNGALQTTTRLAHLDQQDPVIIYIKISDHGIPVQTKLLKLKINIGPYSLKPSKNADVNSGADSSDSPLSDRATFIIIGVVIATFIICSLLISGICIITYKKWKQQQQINTRQIISQQRGSRLSQQNRHSQAAAPTQYLTAFSCPTLGDCNNNNINNECCNNQTYNNSNTTESIGGSSDENNRLLLRQQRELGLKCGLQDPSPSILDALLISSQNYSPTFPHYTNDMTNVTLPQYMMPPISSTHSPSGLPTTFPNILLHHNMVTALDVSSTQPNTTIPNLLLQHNTSTFNRQENTPVSHDELIALSASLGGDNYYLLKERLQN